MLRTILIPLDGTRFGEAALPLAQRLAAAASGVLHLVLAHRPVLLVAPIPDAVSLGTSLDEEQRQRELAYLNSRAASAAIADGPEVTFAQLDAPPGPSIVDEAERIDADLIVMASHGRGALSRMWLGSVADHVIRHAAVPVLVVRPGPEPTAEPPDLHRILVPLDLSSESEHVLGIVSELAILTGASVTFFHVVEPFFDLVDPATPYPLAVDHRLTQNRLDEAHRRLDRGAVVLREAGIAVDIRIREAASAAGGIMEAVEAGEADLVAMTTHGRGGVRRLVLGGVADKVLRGIRKPLLVVRPGVGRPIAVATDSEQG